MSVYLTGSVAYGRTRFRDICLAEHSYKVCEMLRNVWRLVKSICARVFLEAILGFHLRGCALRMVVDRYWSDDIPSANSSS